MTLCVTDTRASHSELTGEFAAIGTRWKPWRPVWAARYWARWTKTLLAGAAPPAGAMRRPRRLCGAIHYFEENARTLAQRVALAAGDFAAFARLVEKSGHSSFECARMSTVLLRLKHQRGCRRRWPSARASCRHRRCMADPGRRLCRNDPGFCTGCAGKALLRCDGGTVRPEAAAICSRFAGNRGAVRVMQNTKECPAAR